MASMQVRAALSEIHAGTRSMRELLRGPRASAALGAHPQRGRWLVNSVDRLYTVTGTYAVAGVPSDREYATLLAAWASVRNMYWGDERTYRPTRGVLPGDTRTVADAYMRAVQGSFGRLDWVMQSAQRRQQAPPRPPVFNA